MRALPGGPSWIASGKCAGTAFDPQLARSPAAVRGPVAQLVEQCPFKALVVGSSPTRPTIFSSLFTESLGVWCALHRRFRGAPGRRPAAFI